MALASQLFFHASRNGEQVEHCYCPDRHEAPGGPFRRAKFASLTCQRAPGKNPPRFVFLSRWELCLFNQKALHSPKTGVKAQGQKKGSPHGACSPIIGRQSCCHHRRHAVADFTGGPRVAGGTGLSTSADFFAK